jgi:hypothetical protein
MAGSISGLSSSDNNQQIQDFLNGKINITRNDLKNTVFADYYPNLMNLKQILP